MKLWTTNQPIVDGKYIIQKLLGGGDFSVTYSATEPRTGKLVAIKTIHPIHQSKPQFAQRQERFVNEARSLAKCSHPYIVPIYELIQEDGLWGIVMEYIEGQDLATYVDEHGVFSEPEALRILQQVGEALTFVHQHGVLHRKLKPNNIILCQDTKAPVLIDFGFARDFINCKIQNLTNQKTEYFAPLEQYEDICELGAYTDVYAIAATLYLLLTGKLPTPANLRQHYVPLVEPQQYKPDGIGDSVNQAILKGMALEPQKRPPSVQEWLELLMLSPDFPDVKLISEVGMDYTNLRDLLATEKWKDADEETATIMLSVAGREKEHWLNKENIVKFPCEDLRTINQLWLKYSKGLFGFSVQRRIWIDCGSKTDYETECLLGDRVGWRVNNEWQIYANLNFSLNAPQGHLPAAFWGWGCWVWEDGQWWWLLGYGLSGVSSIASRLENCHI